MSSGGSQSNNPKVIGAQSFADFRSLASDQSLSKYERIGFPDDYRAGYETAIVDDILRKLPIIRERQKCVLDIGPGCSDVPLTLIDLCRRNAHRYVAIDSEEMLSHLPDGPEVIKIRGAYPQNADAVAEAVGKVDAIICYSVFQYIFHEYNPFDFLDISIDLLAPGGRMLIGDIPNHSMRQRFFSSAAGVAFHQQFTGQEGLPDVAYNQVERGKIDDAVILGILARARAAGVNAYILPQDPALPMSNRREDILLVKP